MRYSNLTGVVGVALLLSPGIAPAQEKCTPVTDAKTLPAVWTLLDSAKLISNLPTAEKTGSQEMVVSVTTGSPPRAFVVDSVAAKTDAGKTLVQRVLAALKPNAKAIPAFQVRVLLGEVPKVTVEPAMRCPPGK